MAVTWLNSVNGGATTLAANLDDSETTITVTSEAALPTSYPYRLTLWDSVTYGDNPASDPGMEIVEVSGQADYYGGTDYDYGNLLTIVRAREDTTAVAHSSGDAAQNRWTAGTLQQVQDAIDALDVRVTALEP